MPTACSRPQPPTRGESPVVPGADSTRRQQAHTAPTRPWPCNTTGLPSTRDPREPHRTIPICQIDPYERPQTEQFRRTNAHRSVAVCAFLWARADYAARQGPPTLVSQSPVPRLGEVPPCSHRVGPDVLAGPGRPVVTTCPAPARAVTACVQAPSRPGMPGGPTARPGPARLSAARNAGRILGTCGPGHRDNPRRDPRHLACRHGCGRDLRDTQDVCHHRADRDGRFHRGVARGQAPQRRLARRSRRGRPVRPLRGGIRPGRTLRAAGWTACRATGYPRAITRPGDEHGHERDTPGGDS